MVHRGGLRGMRVIEGGGGGGGKRAQGGLFNARTANKVDSELDRDAAYETRSAKRAILTHNFD